MPIATISSAGFAYMLAVINAPGVPGLASEAIIPAPPIADAVYSQGLDELKRDGLLVPGARPNTWTLNDDLLTTVMVMATAEYVTRTLHRDGDVMRTALGYIADGGVAELAPLVDDRYQLVLLADPAVLALNASALLLTGGQVAAGSGGQFQDERTGEFVIARVQAGELVRARAAYAHGPLLHIETGTGEAESVTMPLTPNALAEMMASFMSEAGEYKVG